MVKVLTNQEEGYTLSCQATMMSNTKERDTISPTLVDVLAAYEDTNIPNIRPYRYPHYQKTENEKFVQETMVA